MACWVPSHGKEPTWQPAIPGHKAEDWRQLNHRADVAAGIPLAKAWEEVEDRNKMRTGINKKNELRIILQARLGERIREHLGMPHHVAENQSRWREIDDYKDERDEGTGGDG